MSTTKALGDRGEAVTAQYLRERGYALLASQWRCRYGELDLVARDRDGTICFVEVKLRSGDLVGLPREAVDRRKREKLRAAAEAYLSQHGLEGELKELNRRLVALSREAAQGKAWVAGDMTTMGRADVPYETMLEYYHEQAQALAEAGVDLILCETLMGHDEAMAALEGCRMAAAELPVCCSFSVTADGMLYFGGSVYEAAPQVAEFGADAVGINCSVGPDQLESVVRALRESLTVSVIAKPNAGMPEIDDQGNAHYSMHAADFGRHMAALHRAGASILGGCCGTEPPYIAALKAAL